jgi:hypothetical protein
MGLWLLAEPSVRWVFLCSGFLTASQSPAARQLTQCHSVLVPGDLVPAFLEQLDDAVLADEMQRADDDEIIVLVIQ